MSCIGNREGREIALASWTGGPLTPVGAANGEAPLQPLDLVRGGAHGEAEPVLFIAAAHDFGMFV